MKLKDTKCKLIKQEPKSSTTSSSKTGRMSIYSQGYKGEYYNIPVSKLYPFKNQARHFFDSTSLQTLAATIKKHGIRQPLTITPSEDNEGYYEIVSGERRFRAAMQLGLKTVPCIILHDRSQAEEIALIENIQRKDLHPVELMRGYAHLLEKNICNSMQEIADKLGQSKSSVVDIMNLRNLAPNIQELLITKQVKSRDFFRSLCKAKPKEHEKMILENINKNNTYSDAKASSPYNRPAPRKSSENMPTKVLNITYEKNQFIVKKGKLKLLSHPQKLEIKELLTQIMEEVS